MMKKSQSKKTKLTIKKKYENFFFLLFFVLVINFYASSASHGEHIGLDFKIPEVPIIICSDKFSLIRNAIMSTHKKLAVAVEEHNISISSEPSTVALAKAISIVAILDGNVSKETKKCFSSPRHFPEKIADFISRAIEKVGQPTPNLSATIPQEALSPVSVVILYPRPGDRSIAVIAANREDLLLESVIMIVYETGVEFCQKIRCTTD